MDTLVKQLREASAAYYNGGPLLMDDDTFDAAVERLRELAPDHPFLSEVGAAVPDDSAVQLPYPMPSLDKIKPGDDKLGRWLGTTPAAGLVLSEKLDGLSALWMPLGKKLYLRGDGLEGQDVSHLVGLGIQGLVARGANVAVRGELILPRSTAVALGTNQPRAWVNGIVHRKDPAAEDVAKIRFVAYEVLAPEGMTRGQQFIWLENNGYEIPWTRRMGRADGPELQVTLQERRSLSRYDTDGIVVGYNAVPKSESTADKVRNPKDCVAFKMPLAEQSAETTVRAVHWAPSAQGYLIPRVEFDPVVINGATIQFCTGHNARLIVESRIGPGARVQIRRSGDVIPKLDRVVVGAPAPAMPPAGTWRWLGDEATAVHIGTVGEDTALIKARLHHFLKTLDIPGSGPATATALVEAGITGPAALWAAAAPRLSEILGPKTGASLHENMRAAIGKATEQQLMLASSKMPRGVGESKLAALFAVEPDCRRWTAVTEPPPSWTAASLQAFQVEFASYESWRRAQLAFVPYPLQKQGVVATAAVASPAANAQTLCLTGFRDKALEAAAAAAGHTVGATVTGKTTLLLVPDGEVKESEKVKAARAKGIQILSRSQFMQQFAIRVAG